MAVTWWAVPILRKPEDVSVEATTLQSMALEVNSNRGEAGEQSIRSYGPFSCLNSSRDNFDLATGQTRQARVGRGSFVQQHADGPAFPIHLPLIRTVMASQQRPAELEDQAI